MFSIDIIRLWAGENARIAEDVNHHGRLDRLRPKKKCCVVNLLIENNVTFYSSINMLTSTTSKCANKQISK